MEIAIVVPLAFFVTCIIVFWKYIETRSKERMAIIEKGHNPFDGINKAWWLFSNPLSTLKWGMLSIGIGSGVLLGVQMNDVYGWDNDYMSAFILIFGGITLILYYIIVDKKMKNRDTIE